MQTDEVRKQERRRAVDLLTRRWRDMIDSYDSAEVEQRRDVSACLGPVIDAAIASITDGPPDEADADSDSAVHSERLRATRIMKHMFFDAYDEACANSEIDWEDERVPEAINGAERDILGEYVTPELMNDPGALIEAVQKLGVTRETRRGAQGFEVRWACATCRKRGEWTTEPMLGDPLTLQHAATHTVVKGS